MSKIFTLLLVVSVLPTTVSTCALKETRPVSESNALKDIKQPQISSPSRRYSEQAKTQDSPEHSLLSVLTSGRTGHGDEALDPVLGSEEVVDSFVRTVMQCKHVPGLSLAVVKNGESWTKGYGVRDMDTGLALDSRTLLGVGSLTKAFTSALLAIALQDTNRLGNDVSWQTRVKEVVNEDLELAKHLEVNVTLEDVLTHRTGLMAADIMAVAGFPANMSRAQFLRELRYLPDYLSFRLLWHYNNWIYSLAADVTEYLLGDKWSTLLKQRLLLPLGMEDSVLVWDDVNVTSSKMARPYQRIRGSLREVDESVFDLRQGRPSGALAVSADDMSKWMKFLLRGGVLPSGERLISKELMKDLMSPHITLIGSYKDVPVGDKFDGYGFGWFIGSYRGKPRVSHTGGWFGYLSTLTLFPEQDVAVYVSTNGPGTSAGNEAFRTISYFLSDLSLGLSPWLNQSTACTLGKQSAKADEGDEQARPSGEDVKKVDVNVIKNPDRYIGEYSNPLLGEVVIKKGDSLHGLTLQFQRLEGFLIPGEKELVFEVQYTGKTEFYSWDDFKVSRSRLSFSRHRMTPEGKYSSLVLRAPPPENHEKLEFTRKP